VLSRDLTERLHLLPAEVRRMREVGWAEWRRCLILRRGRCSVATESKACLRAGDGGRVDVAADTTSSLPRPIALKIVRRVDASDKGLRERFLRESAAVKPEDLLKTLAVPRVPRVSTRRRHATDSA
jgi:hypothetical protein